MSHRLIHAKQIARMRKALRVTPPRFLDLVQWLQDHRHAQTAGAARKLILAGKVRHGSHKVGITQQNVQQPDGTLALQDTVYPFVPADWRADLIVLKD